MVLGKRVAIFDWEWGLNSAPREGQKIPWLKTECIEIKISISDIHFDTYFVLIFSEFGEFF